MSACVVILPVAILADCTCPTVSLSSALGTRGADAGEERATAVPMGLEWIETPNAYPVALTLRWTPELRERHDAAHPDARMVTREPPPLEYYSPNQRLALVAMQRQ